MKTSTVFALLMAFVLSIGVGGYSADVEAKKFGGGKSFGKSYSIPKQTSTPTSTVTKSTTGTGTKSGGFLGGMGGGLLGGLLVGGLFASIFAGGGFEGLAFGDILLFALVAFLVYKFFIAPRKQAMAAQQSAGNNAMFRNMNDAQSPNHSMGGFGQAGTSMQLPPGFDAEAFVADAKNHYIAIQKAWDENDFVAIQEYVSPELYNLLREERAKLGADKPSTEVVSLMVDLVRGEFEGAVATITLKFSGWIKEGELTTDTTEFWHLEKSMTEANAPWIIVGIQQDH